MNTNLYAASCIITSLILMQPVCEITEQYFASRSLQYPDLTACHSQTSFSCMFALLADTTSNWLRTGEMLVGPRKVFFMDEISTGLDSSTTFQIVKCMRDFAHLGQATILMSLLQPSPEVYNLFDDVMLLSEGAASWADILLQTLLEASDKLVWAMCTTDQSVDLNAELSLPWGFAGAFAFAATSACSGTTSPSSATIRPVLHSLTLQLDSLLIAIVRASVNAALPSSVNHPCNTLTVLSCLAGNMAFHGPREDVVDFFLGLGFRCPVRKGVPDFLQEVTSRKDQQVRFASPFLLSSNVSFSTSCGSGCPCAAEVKCTASVMCHLPAASAVLLFASPFCFVY